MKNKSFFPFVKFKDFGHFVRDYNLLLILCVFCLSVLSFFMGDRINIGGGFGWDGFLLGELAGDFYTRLEAGVNQFWIARTFPSFLVFHILQVLRLESTPQNIIYTFSCLNIFSVTFAAYIWCLIARELKIGLQGQWLGFIALFLNHAVLKTTSYLPVQTDAIAYGIGMAMLYFYLKGKTLWLYFLLLLGLFTWPTILHMGALMLLFPRQFNNTELSQSSKIKYHLHRWIALIPALAGGIYMYILLPGNIDYLDRGKPLQSVGYLSLAIATSYLFFGLSEILNNSSFFRWQNLQAYLQRKSFYLTFIILLVLLILPAQFATIPGKDQTLGHTLYLITLTSILQPGVFFLAHIIYWGPCVILMAFLWRPICQLVQQYGWGLTLWIALSLVHSLDSESRHFVTFYPLLVPFFVKVTEKFKWTNQQYWGLAIASLLVSKIWLTIGSIGGDPRQFPSQIFFMNHGPWISNTMYAVQGGIACFLTYWLYDFYLRRRSHKDLRE